MGRDIPPPRGFARHELGFFVPSVAQPAKPRVPNIGLYLTYRELTGGQTLGHSAIVEALRKLSAADCLWAIANINTQLFAETRPAAGPQLQRRLVAEAIGDSDLGRACMQALARGVATAVFCEQQLVHLARLIILYADRRPHDDFASGTLRDEWAKCLIGVTDLLDANLDLENHDERLAWEIRQCALNHREDQLPVTAIHHEVYRVLWSELQNAGSAEVEDAFQRHTDMSIGDYFTVGTATLVRLMMRGQDRNGPPLIQPNDYFSAAQMEPSIWQAFFALTARDLDALRAELVDEVEEYGETTYGSLTFERFPLVEIETGTFLPLSMYSLQRRISQGVFHMLSEAAAADGHDRRRYSSKFGRVFQESVERTLRRGIAFGSDDVPIAADVRYGPPKQPVDSSDVILGYDRHPMFVEVVSGPLQAGTFTQGHLCCFEADADRLVVKKAKQLDRSIRDFFTGNLEIQGIDPNMVSLAWPVIVTSHQFPHMELVTYEVERQVHTHEYLQQERVAPLAIVSSEELFFCEGFMQQGKSFLALIRGWKSGQRANFSFKNYLIELGDGRAPGSTHFKRRFAEANAEYMSRMLGEQTSVESVLANMQSPDAPDALDA